MTANSKAIDDIDSPAQADTPTPTGEDHNIPTEPKEAETTASAPQLKLARKDTLEESRPSPPFPQRLKKQKQEYQKTRIKEFETVAATEACLAMMHNKVPAKKTDPGNFTIPCSIENNYSSKAICDPDEHAPIILGRPFLATSKVLIDFDKGELVLRVEEQQLKINVFLVPSQQDAVEECKALHILTDTSTLTKPYMGVHTERDKGVVTLRDA
ncbi:hypothetical protein V6N12_061097 [Hibiscus sabdariffa]|uniref:Reverse transcriptase domain-containing protein n=1 Tax=Hibiscus sabdariffa TaxID=183260 RepID=A0ABR2DZG9_9ROSI